MLECSLKEHPDIDRLQSLFVGVLLQAMGVHKVHGAMGNRILLVLDLLPEEVAHGIVVLADELIQLRGATIKDGGDDIIQGDVLQYILNNVVHAIVTQALTDNIHLREQLGQDLAFPGVSCDHIEHHHVTLLTITMYTPHTLLQTVRIPRNVPIDQ